MKKVLLAVLAVMFMAGVTYAQSISAPTYRFVRGKTTQQVHTVTADATGDVTGTISINAWVHSICVNPSTATTGYDLTFVDPDGFDLLDNGDGTVQGTSLSDTNNKCFTPTPGGAAGSLPTTTITMTGDDMGNGGITVVKFNLWDE